MLVLIKTWIRIGRTKSTMMMDSVVDDDNQGVDTEYYGDCNDVINALIFNN
jgi:hypothetical protein